MAARSRTARWVGLGVAGGAVLLAGGTVLFAGTLAKPFVEDALADAVQRPVSIGRLHLSLGRIVTATADEVIIANPPGFPEEATPWLARIPHAVVEVAAWDWILGRGLGFPRVELDQPRVEARGLPDGQANYLFRGDPPPGEAAEEPGPRIGRLVVREGSGHAVIAGLGADFAVTLATVDPPDAPPRIEGEARGTYAGQPITAKLSGGALLALQEEGGQPWPIRLEVANGPSRLALQGTLRDPLALRGADLRVDLAGPSMAMLAPLTGVPFPTTPPFRLGGQFDYVAGRVRLMQAEGRIGRTDVSGGLMVTIGRARPDVAAELRSRRVDLRDLAGFVGAAPGRPEDPGQTPEQRRALAAQRADPFLLPRDPISIPKLRAADIHVDYSADRIEGRRMPFDSLVTQFDIVDGVVDIKRLVFPIGGGELSARATLTPRENDTLHAKAEIELRRVAFSRLMNAAGTRGSGTVGGVGRVEGTGRSVSEILAHGQGGLTAVMVGGDLSAFLVDLSGLRFGTALLSALGLPEREKVECLIADLALQGGALQARSILLDTESAVVTGSGRMEVASERLDLRIRTESKRLTVGSLPTPIAITGRLGDPSVAPEVGELAARAGVAAGLGVLLPPLALLPTVQLGVGENGTCEALQARGRRGQRR